MQWAHHIRRTGDFNNGIKYKDYDFYHAGNSNKEDVSWTMKDGTVAGNLSVSGDGVLDLQCLLCMVLN